MDKIEINQFINLDFQSSEAYKTLRSNILFCGSDIKSIGLTSTIPNEGKSSVSLNLAISMAESGKKVILIDADMRNSVLIGMLRINKPIKGLSHHLSGMNTMDEIIYESDIMNLSIIFSGPVPPNPSELLSNERFSNLIKVLSQYYDYIFVDTPPLGIVIDGAVAAKVCDGMILVVEANAVSCKLIRKVQIQLEKADCKILGAVLNKVENNPHSYYGKYYREYFREPKKNKRRSKENKKKKLCFAASSGGHYEQLLMLKPLMDRYKSFIITEKTQYKTEEIKNVKIYYLKQINRKEKLFLVKFLSNVWKSVVIFGREKPDYIITTGVLSMIPISIIAKIFRKKLIYIESFAKVTTPTLTGRFLYKFADLFFVQWEELLEFYPKAIYKGGIY